MPKLREAGDKWQRDPRLGAERLTALNRAGFDHFVLAFQFHGLETVAFDMEQMKFFPKKWCRCYRLLAR